MEDNKGKVEGEMGGTFLRLRAVLWEKSKWVASVGREDGGGAKKGEAYEIQNSNIKNAKVNWMVPPLNAQVPGRSN